jgi:drug/metabolite transporter (DMT)-like permease
LAAIFLGILSALSWGAGDFSGGLASRSTGPYRAVLYGEAVGLLLLFGAAVYVHEPATQWSSLLLSAAGGLAGTFGLLILYYAMSRGQMSIVAPVSALFTALLPVAAGTVIDGVPSLAKLAGFIVALAAIWMVAQEAGEKSQLTRLSDLRLPLFSGLCFGLYFILIHQATQQTVLWPMIVSRSVGTLTVVIFVLARRDSWRVSWPVWPFIALNGILDVGGNAFYILAGQIGRMDVAAVLSSLYPGATVLLAWLVLKERISRVQKLGIFAALIAIVLMTL